MDDGKLEELITNLELVGCKLDTAIESDLQIKDQLELLQEATGIIRKTLDDLRIIEIQREIASHTETGFPET